MAKKFDIKNVSMVFLPFVPAHVEYFKDGRPILAKLKNGSWDIIYYYETNDSKFENGKEIKFTIHKYSSTDCETCWNDEDIEYWARLPKLEK